MFGKNLVWKTLILVAFTTTYVVLADESTSQRISSTRSRRCCPYAFPYHEGETGSCTASHSCLFQRPATEGGISSDPGCKVVEDSKRWPGDVKQKSENILKCLGQSFDNENSLDYGSYAALEWGITPYLMSDPRHQSRLASTVGVELSVNGSEWTKMRFRMANYHLCKGHSNADASDESHCFPRCVTVRREEEVAIGPDDKVGTFLYDCELGFYTSPGKMTTSTSGSTYSIDICITRNQRDACGSFFFRMPQKDEVSSLSQGLILLDKKALLEHKIGLVFPHDVPAGGSIRVVKLEIMNPNIVQESTFDESEENSSLMKETLARERRDRKATFSTNMTHWDEGFYQVEVGFWIDDELGGSRMEFTEVATIEVSHDLKRGHTMSVGGTVALVTFTLLALLLYFRYLWVRKIKQIDPESLYISDVDKKAPSVLIITDLENRQHVDIVEKINAYLKANCGVSEVLFALDPSNGMNSSQSASEGDPWRWSQEAAEKVSRRPNGFVIVLGSPPRDMSLQVYKDFSDNQAFVSAQTLKDMDSKGSVRVVLLPYSDAQSLPESIPQHLKKNALKLPGDFNQLVSDVHHVGRKPLFDFLPFKFIQPEICYCNLSKTASGSSILESIDKLDAKVKQFKLECEPDIYEPDSEPLQLPHQTKKRRSKPRNPSGKMSSALVPLSLSPAVEEGVEVNIEANLLSLNSSTLDKRDPDDVTEEC